VGIRAVLPRALLVFGREHAELDCLAVERLEEGHMGLPHDGSLWGRVRGSFVRARGSGNERAGTSEVGSGGTVSSPNWTVTTSSTGSWISVGRSWRVSERALLFVSLSAGGVSVPIVPVVVLVPGGVHVPRGVRERVAWGVVVRGIVVLWFCPR
jgi:hypothetical protein